MKKIIIFSTILAVIDQTSKLIIANTIQMNQKVSVIDNILYFTYLKNTGAAWNLFEGAAVFLIVISILAIIFSFIIIKKEKNISKINTIAYSLLLGGIVGNLIDRIHVGGVIDFIYVDLFNFPIFNISDICIVIGVIIFAYSTIRSDYYGKNNINQKPTDRQVSK